MVNPVPLEAKKFKKLFLDGKVRCLNDGVLEPSLPLVAGEPPSVSKQRRARLRHQVKKWSLASARVRGSKTDIWLDGCIALYVVCVCT